MFKKKKSKLNIILRQITKNRDTYFSGELNNIVFLDFDGVLNLDINNYSGNLYAKIPMKNLNKFCLENEFKIIVISSWRKTLNYKELLYEAGLNPNITILGATDILEKDRESEIIDYLEKHQNINKFIILDDGDFWELKRFQIQTVFSKGFDNTKYEEAQQLIRSINWKTFK